MAKIDTYNLPGLSEKETEEVLHEAVLHATVPDGSGAAADFEEFLGTLSEEAREEYARNYKYFKERRLEMDKDMRKWYSKKTLPENWVEAFEKIADEAKDYMETEASRLIWALSDETGLDPNKAFDLVTGPERDKFKQTLDEYMEMAENGLKLTPEQETILRLNGTRARVTRLSSLVNQLDLYSSVYAGRLEETFTGIMNEIAEDRYLHGVFDVFHLTGLGTSLNRFSYNRLRLMLINPWAGDNRNCFERLELNQQKLRTFLHKDFSRAVITGEGYAKIMDRLAEQLDTTKEYVKSLVTTEAAFVASLADEMCYDDLGIKQFQFLATLDSKTSEICQSMDLRIFDYSTYEPGLNAPPLHAHCRSTTLPYVDSWKNLPGYIPRKRAARGKDGKTYDVPAEMTYEEWKNMPEDVLYTE